MLPFYIHIVLSAYCLLLVVLGNGELQRERHSPSQGTAKVFLDQRKLALNSGVQRLCPFHASLLCKVLRHLIMLTYFPFGLAQRSDTDKSHELQISSSLLN